MNLEGVQFNRSVLSDSLWPHGLHHTRAPCPLPTPRVYSNSCPFSQWCHPTIHPLWSSSSPAFRVSLPASGSFQMSQFFPSGGQSIGVSASTLVLPMTMQDWFPLGMSNLGCQPPELWFSTLSLNPEDNFHLFPLSLVSNYSWSCTVILIMYWRLPFSHDTSLEPSNVGICDLS